MGDNKTHVNTAELEEELQKYLVKYPDEQQINETIQVLRAHVPIANKEDNRFTSILKHAWIELNMIRKSYWVASVLLFLIGYFVTTAVQSNPLMMLIILAPLPFVLGLLEVFKGREAGILEIEMTCKFSAYEIMLSRLLIIGVNNLILNILLTLFLAPIVSLPLWKLIVIWFIPFSLFSAVALWLSMKFRGHAFILTIISSWVIFTSATLYYEKFIVRIIHLHANIHILLLVTGILLLCLQIRRVTKIYRSVEEVKTYEINY